MARYSFNGTVLHELPVTGGYQIIFKNGTTYGLLNSTQQLFCFDGHICAAGGSDFSGYVTLAEANAWAASEITFGGDGASVWYWICPESDLVWTSHNIPYATISEDGQSFSYGATAYPGTVPVWAAPDVPVGSFGWNTGGSTASLSQSNVTIPQMAAGSGWHSQLELHCIASVGDGGEIKTEWFCNGSLVDWGTAAGGSSHSVLKPSAEAVGEFQYYARVTNTLNGASTSDTTPTITVAVVSYNFDQFNPDTGDSTGTLTPGIVVPDDEPGGDSGGDSGGTGGDDPGTGAGGFDLRSWLIGFVLGLAGKPLPAGNGGGGNG